jgi:hypothetical protein
VSPLLRRITGCLLLVVGIAGGSFLANYPLVADTGDIPDSILALSVFFGGALARSWPSSGI